MTSTLEIIKLINGSIHDVHGDHGGQHGRMSDHMGGERIRDGRNGGMVRLIFCRDHGIHDVHGVRDGQRERMSERGMGGNRSRGGMVRLQLIFCKVRDVHGIPDVHGVHDESVRMSDHGKDGGHKHGGKMVQLQLRRWVQLIFYKGRGGVHDVRIHGIHDDHIHIHDHDDRDGGCGSRERLEHKQQEPKIRSKKIIHVN